MRLRVALAALAVAGVANGAPPGSQCASCHPAETKLHQRTKMAQAMMPALSSAFAENLPDGLLHESSDGYSFAYRRLANGIEVTAFRGGEHARGLIDWVLGAGAQGQTPLIRTERGMLESRVSYFPQLRQYGITVGQDAGASANAEAALGLKQTARDVRNCMGCHSTGITSDLQPAIPGVQCEKCHEGADEHARGGKAPFNPGRLSGPEQVRFCGSCHRVKPPLDDAQLENLRFQPLRLMKSRCFESGKLACTTCHPAHQDARRGDPDFYDEKCHACHDSQAFHLDERRKGDCIGCHMPYVQLHPALNFTDHFIRVVKAGDLPEWIVRRRNPG